MSAAHRLRQAACLGVSLFVLAGCAATEKVVGAPTTVALSPREHVDRAATLLSAGDPEAARLELAQALAQQPGDPRARKLLVQIDKDPVALLGSRYYAYRVRPGESLSQIAAKFLGDSQLFYALARYNGIAAPDTLEAGRALKIPGEPKRAVLTRPTPAAPATPSPAAAPDPRRASELRGAALEQMSGGKIDRAVKLLRQARDLDPANPLIRRDLDRATRIQNTVRTSS
jgi:tetratricopeptide (TPR) repeat protein